MAGGKNTDIDVYSAEIVAEAEKRDKLIKKKLIAGEASLYDVASALEWFKSSQAYRTYGYKSFAELADKRYGIKKTEAYSYVSVVERFSNSGVCKPYSISQLMAALPLTDFEIYAHLKPEMSVREIKKIVKKLVKPPPAEASIESAPASSEGAGIKLNNENEKLNIENGQISTTDIAHFDTMSDFDDLKSCVKIFLSGLEKELEAAFAKGAENIKLCLVWERENPKQPDDEAINEHTAQQQETKKLATKTKKTGNGKTQNKPGKEVENEISINSRSISISKE